MNPYTELKVNPVHQIYTLRNHLIVLSTRSGCVENWQVIIFNCWSSVCAFCSQYFIPLGIMHLEKVSTCHHLSGVSRFAWRQCAELKACIRMAWCFGRARERVLHNAASGPGLSVSKSLFKWSRLFSTLSSHLRQAEIERESHAGRMKGMVCHGHLWLALKRRKTLWACCCSPHPWSVLFFFSRMFLHFAFMSVSTLLALSLSLTRS